MRKSTLRATAAVQALALLGAGAFIATPAAAQDTTGAASNETQPTQDQQAAVPKPEDQADSDDAIVVTGSRIVRPDLEAPSPVTTVDSEQFDLTGTVTVETLLNELPQLIPGNTRTSNNQGGEDFSTLDLRGLGPNRTLILVDGERVPASSTSGVVDIGTIPAGLIERVDVVTGGASAVYGSDAMAGVVNFILKDNFEGLEVSSQYGISDHGDGSQFNIQALLGGNFADDRGNMTFFTSYFTREAVGQGDRDVTRDAGVVYYDYNYATQEIFFFVPDHLTPPSAYTSRYPNGGIGIAAQAGSSTPPWGLISNNATNPFQNLSTILPGNFGAGNTDTNCDGVPGGAVNTGNLSFNDQGELVPANASGQAAGLCAFADRSTSESSSRFNFNPLNYLVTPYERFNLTATGRYDITDSIRLKVVGNYVDSSQEVNLAPTPATGISVPVTNAFIALGDATNGAPCGVGISCNEDLRQALLSRPNPNAPFTYARRFFETGPRVGIYNSKTQTLRGTLSGPIGWGFNWDLTGSYGKTTANIEARGNINNAAVQQGLNNCINTAGVINGAGILPGCVPLDIFGANTLFAGYDLTGRPDMAPGSMLNFVRIDTQERREFEQVRIAGNITGNLFELPAGPVGVAVGAEARTDRGSIVVDDAQRTGNIYGFNAVQNQAGKVNVKEVYGEIRVPILADMFLVDELSLEAGARFSDYSTVNGLLNYKFGMQYSPFDWMKFRAIYNKAARAPSIVELFQNGDQGFPSYVDPCNDIAGRSATALAICSAQTPAFAAGGGYTGFNQTNAQVQAFAFGNPDISEETAKTFTVGAVLTPNLGLGRFSATIDYYKIRIEDIITTFGAQFFINDCYLAGNASSCDRITRDPGTGQLTAVNTATGNQGVFKSSGVDATVNYVVPFADLGLGIPGRLRFQELISWNEEISFGGANFSGAGAAGIGGNFPEWKSTMTLAYDSDSFTAQMRWNWQSDLEDVGFTNIGDNGAPDVPGLSYFDLSLRKKIGDNFEITGIVQNLFNQKAKKTVAGFFAEGGTDVAYWNPVILGRYFTLQAKVKM
ncbi:TonB-dependent receptor [Sphingomonas sp. HDW15A]|uniref:TonB-dependent receptor domain-containing protein n=1 Tax=Sphingomonas sp. HDW15A TaxID=2714942 RepID=UPI00140B2BCA|nr:TonB-dependent receptor [Sphingomonas sp. HDW15A]QIK96805.1 TonB-dependent receptor [Sphingomonas sp. HDW15A]